MTDPKVTIIEKLNAIVYHYKAGKDNTMAWIRHYFDAALAIQAVGGMYSSGFQLPANVLYLLTNFDSCSERKGIRIWGYLYGIAVCNRR